MMLLAKFEGPGCCSVCHIIQSQSSIIHINSAASHENEDWINGEKTEDVVAFLDRLYTAKRKVETRIVDLGGRKEDSVSKDLHLWTF